MNDITSQERLNLKKLMNETNYQDNTEYIRKIKHSVKIRDDIRKLDLFKKQKHNQELKKSNPDLYLEKCREESIFLFNNYTDIFNRLVKDEIDMSIMTELLTILKLIEDEKIDQNDGSILIGKILKNLYLDSALKHGDNLDKQYSKSENENENENVNISKNISWKEYKLYVK
jgi:hypothetical protein